MTGANDNRPVAPAAGLEKRAFSWVQAADVLRQKGDTEGALACLRTAGRIAREPTDREGNPA